MNRQEYERIDAEMQRQMDDAAHDKHHVYRVLFAALDIASHEKQPVDRDVLIAACLLHDIGRREQFEDDSLCHAQVGAGKAYEWLIGQGYSQTFAAHVGDCISSHRFRGDNAPATIEAKILFDADKIDAAGAMGMARTLLYTGIVGRLIYNTDENGSVLDGSGDEPESFFKEYNRKLANIYDKFHTKRGAEIAQERKWAAIDFYQALLQESRSSYERGMALLDGELDDQR